MQAQKKHKKIGGIIPASYDYKLSTNLDTIATTN